MTKKNILDKLKKTILGEADTTPGITVTNKVKNSDKKFNDEYYKSTNKKFKDYLGIKKDDFDTPKVNTDDELELTYHGSGMEGLSYDNEGTEVEKKFVKRNDDLNKPSKDYYLKKDEVNDVYAKKKKEGESYRKQKKVFQNTPPVRAIQAEKVKSESTIKRLTYKTEFINENIAFNLIPENFKKNDLIFEMTDGNKLMKIRWEGGSNGRPVVLLSKDSKKISQELERMHHLFEYNSRDTFGKSNLLTEEKQLHEMMDSVRSEVDEVELTKEQETKEATKKSVVDPSKPINFTNNEWSFNPYTKRLNPDEFREKVIAVIREIPGYSDGVGKQVSGAPITFLINNLNSYIKKQLITPEQAESVRGLTLNDVRSGK